MTDSIKFVSFKTLDNLFQALRFLAVNNSESFTPITIKLPSSPNLSVKSKYWRFTS